MQISHEVPTTLLELSRTFNDYDYALVHLFETNSDYYNFFKQSLAMGREVILDNSVFELGAAFDATEYKHWINELAPTYYIIPDVLDNAEQTIANILAWENDSPSKTIGVIQGSTLEEATNCYEQIKDHVDRLAISFNCKFYESNSDMHILQQWMTGRQNFIEHLRELGIKKDVHLLGCSLPQEFIAYKNPKYDFIKSVDTSNPIVHAINNIEYTSSGLETKVSTKLIEYMNVQDINQDILGRNIQLFRSFCNG